jgi:hypothetical protein
LRWLSRSALRSPCAGAGQALDLQLHQPLRGKADHLAQQIRVGALLQKRAKGIMSSVIVVSSVQVACATQPYRRPR